MVGAVVGNYRLIRKLGEGGMGAVYLGQHTLLGRRAAVKVLLPALSARPDVVNRFFNEARAVTSISDPGIVQVFDFGFHVDGSAFIVMEYLEGEPLDRRLARAGRLPVAEAMRLCRQIASSLAAAHAQRIVHRDLKPENVFLVRDGEVATGERSKILDFGIAKLSDEHPGKLKTSTGVLMGTPVYMSPEQCRGVSEIDHRADIYSLGCVMFRLVTGRAPFEGEAPGDIISAHIREPAPAPSSRAPDIPPEVDALVLRCLAKSPADRYQTMTEVAAATDGVLLRCSGALTSHQLAAPVAVNTAPAEPTTLGASTGQLVMAVRSRRIGLWIAGALIAGAAAAGIAILVRGGSSGAGVTSRPGIATRDDSPAPQPAPPMVADASVVELAEPSPSNAVAEPPAMKPVETVDVSPNAVPVAEDKTATGAPADDKALSSPKPKTEKPGRKSKPPESRTTKQPVAREPFQIALKPGPGANPAIENNAGTPRAASPDRCGKAAFAPVYNAAAPSKDAIGQALATLRACRDAGAISDADFKQTQDALIAKLVARP